MLERFLVPLDTSANSERVLPYVRGLAKQLGQPITLLSVIPDMKMADLNPLSDEIDAGLGELNEYRRKYAEDYLTKICGQLRDAGVWASPLVALGDGADTIIATATAQHTGVIAMATHGRVGPERWFLGSVADKVVRAATVPVLLIRPREDADKTPETVTALVVPLDGSPEAESALPYASFLAKNLNVPVTLLRTLPMSWALSSSGIYGYNEGLGGSVYQAIEDEAKGYLERTVQRVRDEGIDAGTWFSPFAAPASEIAVFAEKTPGTLVVMTSHGRTGLERTVFGSVADQVIHSCGAPVLVVRPAA